MAQRIHIHFLRADLAASDSEWLENILSDVAPCEHGDDKLCMNDMLRRFIKARGVEIKHAELGDCWTVFNGVTLLRFKTRSQAYQFVLECIVNTGGVPPFAEADFDE